MPLYEFRCGECNKVSEFQLKMADPSPSVCPVCGKGTLSKIMSLPAFQLKGGGWYKEGYDGKSNKKDDSPKAEASSTPAAAPAAPSAAPAAPSTPAPASTPKPSSNS